VKSATARHSPASAAPGGQPDGVEIQEKISAAARDLFLAEGVEAVTIRSIARRAGCSVGLLYHYFESKEDLLAHLLANTFARLNARLRRQAGSHAAPAARLRAVLAAYVRFGLDHPHDYELLFAARNPEQHPHLMQVFRTQGMACYDAILGCCEQCARAGLLARGPGAAEEVAQVLWAGCHGLVHLLNTAREFPFQARERLLKSHVEVLIRGALDGRHGGKARKIASALNTVQSKRV